MSLKSKVFWNFYHRKFSILQSIIQGLHTSCLFFTTLCMHKFLFLYVSPGVTSHDFTSGVFAQVRLHHITSQPSHITSHIISYHIMSYVHHLHQIKIHHSAPHHSISHQIMSQQIISQHVKSQHITSCDCFRPFCILLHTIATQPFK